MVKIPQIIFDAYVSAANDMLDAGFGVTCKVVYPSTKTPCPSLTTDPIGHKPPNRYVSGSIAPTNMGPCAVCGGQGYIETEASDIVMLRVYYDPKKFIKIAELVNVAQTSAQAIGSINDVHKFRNANRITVQWDQPNPEIRTYERISEWVPFGLGPEKLFFICNLKRAG